MTKREQRVINAFCNCVRSGEFTADYAITLIEDRQRYGWLSEAAYNAFYDFLDSLTPEEPPAAEPVEEEPIDGDPDDEAEDPDGGDEAQEE